MFLTGASGYLGHRLVRELRAHDAKVGALVRRAPADASAFDEVIVADVAEPISARPSGRYDVLVHLAAANDIASRDPATALRGTTLGTRRALDFGKAAAIPGFLYVSTTQVYGRDAGLVDECTEPRPRNDYALTHLFAEQYVRYEAARWAVARVGNVYGAPSSRAQERWSLVPNCFCKAAHERGRITLTSSGLQERDFLGASDVAVLLHAMARRLDDLHGTVVNLTSGRSETVLAMAERVAARFTARTGRPCPIEVRSSEPTRAEPLLMPTALRERLGLRLEAPQRINDEIDRTFEILEAP